jgi:hypothetical protein
LLDLDEVSILDKDFRNQNVFEVTQIGNKNLYSGHCDTFEFVVAGLKEGASEVTQEGSQVAEEAGCGHAIDNPVVPRQAHRHDQSGLEFLAVPYGLHL